MDAGSAKAHRSTTGCWTCKLRRKKCDERHPACDACTVLQITCHFGPDKPQWLDGGVKQEDMLLSVKRDVRRNAPYRQVKRKNDVADTLPAVNHTEPAATNSSAASAARRPAACRLAYKDAGAEESFEQSDTMLLMFYLEHVFPILFPFYRPSPTDGGKAWVLEMILNRPVLRRATLCQSAYFFAVINGTNADDALWNAVLARTRDSYDMLRRALHAIEGTRLVEHVHGAVRILAGIIQVQRFENVALSFTNSRTHLDAALTMFQQLLDLTNGGGTTDSKSVFEGVLSYLGNGLPLASSEQTAFRFSTALLLFDDIIASTATPAAPRLYELHRGLLTSNYGCAPPIRLESVVGCHNSIMLLLGEISTLDAWKQRYTEAASLDVMALVQRATAIKSSLLNQLMRFEAEQRAPENDAPSILQLLTPEEHERLSTLAKHKTSLNRIWAHAALLYLHTVVSGWQPADVEVAHHVSGVIDLLIHHDSPSILVRSMVWPFCVAGCLAQQKQEVKFREVVERLQPRALFRTVHQALEIMEGVWRDREIGVARRDLAECLQDQGELILLI